ncbi:DUF3363 domain-containing protein [Methylorubrum rhodesianum]|uniref:DUF3363 domain-containing protein n=1 Tax=Methylobacteriaceae TaxID=119045 RepID=UPI003D088A02
MTDGRSNFTSKVHLIDGRNPWGFSLVPWRPVIEQRLGQQIAATVRGGGVSWEIGRQRGVSV